MSEQPPKFSKGNPSFISALNQVAEYARIRGVNPNGVAGWSQTPDGWQPPRLKPSATGEMPWDLKRATVSETLYFTMAEPYVIKPRIDPPSFLAVTYETANGVEIDQENSYLVAEITSLTTPAIQFKVISATTFEGDGRYTFSGSTMTKAQIPIWYFSTTTFAQATRIGIGNDTFVYGVKMVPAALLRVHYTHAVDAGDYKLVLDLI